MFERSPLSTWMETRWDRLMIRPLQRGKNDKKHLRAVYCLPPFPCYEFQQRSFQTQWGMCCYDWDFHSVAVPWCDKLTCLGETSVFGVTQIQIHSANWQGEHRGYCGATEKENESDVERYGLTTINIDISLWIDWSWWSSVTFKTATFMNRATSPWRRNPSEQQDSWERLPPTSTLLQSHLCAQIRLTGLTYRQDVKATSFALSGGKTPSTLTRRGSCLAGPSIRIHATGRKLPWEVKLTCNHGNICGLALN